MAMRFASFGGKEGFLFSPLLSPVMMPTDARVPYIRAGNNPISGSVVRGLHG